MKYVLRNIRLAKTIRSLARIMVITLSVSVISFFLFHSLSSVYSSWLIDQQVKKMTDGMAQDFQHLKEQGDQVASLKNIQDELILKDSKGLIDSLKYEIKNRSIGLMGIANSDGVIIGRTLSPGKRGDNVFLTAPAGRVVAQGKSVKSFELTGFYDQIFLTTARPIIKDSKMIGALFANYLADDNYSRHIKDTYLSDGSEVVFYSKKFGVYGDSFNDKRIRKLIYSYFNTGSDWIQGRTLQRVVSFDDLNVYSVRNIIIPGLDSVTGGALIFVPRQDLSSIADLLTVLATIIIFLILSYRHHTSTSKEERGWHYYLLVFVMTLVVATLSSTINKINETDILKLNAVPYPLYNSTVHFQPESGIFDMGFDQQFTIVVDTGDEAVNAAQVSINFDPEAVSVKKIDDSDSSCSHIIDSRIDNKKGNLFFSCILDEKEGQRTIKLGDIVLSPNRTGTFGLSFDLADTSVFASDGLGTNVLRYAQDGSYRVDKFNTILSDISTSTASTSERSFVVYSTTHPNEARWYNSREAHFVWRGIPNATYRYAFDTSSSTVPDGKNTIKGNSIDIPIPSDGIYYFHLQLDSGGPVAHYRIQSDTTPPDIIYMKTSEDTVRAGDVVRLIFQAEDNTSGVQKNYYVDLGNNLFLPTGPEIYVPFVDAGDEKITLRVYDGADNYTDQSKVIHVESH